ncbi:MAG: C1 family peptidase [Saprospiraceae bacterium]|nr:C1 family peptidase [Saprospiraceae bacterium]
MKIKHLISLAILFSHCFESMAQRYKTGGVLDEKYTTFPVMPHYGSKADDENLQKNRVFSLKPYCPKVGNQGETQTCVPWAIGYAAMSILQAVENNWKDRPDKINEFAYSTYFAYNQLVDKKRDCQVGLKIREVIELIQNKGNITAQEFDTRSDVCGKTVSMELQEKAITNRICNPLSLNNILPSSKINNVKTALLQEKPVVICLSINKSFEKISESGVWNPKSDNSYRGIHAVCIIGYDDGKSAFEIMNSWGEEWGNNGFAWIKYDDFVQYCAEAYTFSLNHGTGKLLSSKVYLRYPSVMSGNDIHFDTLKVQYDASRKVYDIKQKTIEVGAIIQPFIAQTTKESYLYVFSYDAVQNITVHWPRNQKVVTQNESPIIATTKIELAIPSESSAIQLSKIGTEYFCFLWSNEPIVDFNDLLISLKNKTNTLTWDNINAFFKEKIPPLSTIRYEKQKIGFSTYQEKTCIVPIIIRLNVQ